ncbi:MAG: hypothetical protein WCL56_11810 [Sediminibacterium sp.]
MVIKTFISTSVHKNQLEFYNQLLQDKSLQSNSELIIELEKELEIIEDVFQNYKSSYENLKVLINRYHIQEINIRKKIKKMKAITIDCK